MVSGVLEFESPSDVVEVGALSVPYFNDAKKQVTLQQEMSEDLSINPKTFKFNVNGSVLFEDDDAVSAKVSIDDRETNTSNGVYSLADIIRETDANNKPKTYDEKVVVQGDFETQQKSFVVDGTNKEVNFMIPIPKFWVYSNNAKPNGAMIRGWLNNEAILEAEVINNNFETNKYEAKTSKVTLDSLVVVKQGFDKLKRTNFQMNNNGTRFDFDLNEVIGDETFEVSIKPYTADNKSMADFLNEPYTLFVKNKRTGETKTFTQQSNNAMNIEISGTPQDELLIWHLNNKLADYIVIEHPDQYWTDKNVAQNRATYLWDHSQKFDTLKTTIEDFTNHKYNKNKPLELYTPRYEYEVEGYGGGGAIVKFSDEIFYRMLTGRSDGGSAGYIKNWKLPGVTHIDKIYMGYKINRYDFWDNNEPISQEKLDEMMNFTREVLKVSKSASGRVRLPYVEHIIQSENDSIVQVGKARGWTETSISWRYDGTPNNSLVWGNANLRIKYGTAKYDDRQNTGAIFEEEFEHLYGTIDPVIGSSSPYIFKLKDGQVVINTLGQTMGAVSAMSDRGTRLLPANK